MSEEDSDDEVIVDASAKAPSRPVFLPNTSENHRSAQSLVRWIVGFLFILQSKHHLPNSAIEFLIKFIVTLLCVLGRLSAFVHDVQVCFPHSLHTMRKRFPDDIHFSRYPICPKCNRLYHSYKCCIQKTGSRWSSKRCIHIQFPNHPRTECNTLLMKTVHLRSGKTILYPLKVYSYSGLKSTLQNLLMRPSFVNNCEHWKSMPASNILSDIYDGKNFEM